MVAKRTSEFAPQESIRREVTQSNWLLHRLQLSTAFGHSSARIPGSDRFLIPTRRSPALAHPDELLVLNCDGETISGQGEPNSEFWIHARIYSARPDVGAVVHAHSPACIVLGQSGHSFAVVHNSGSMFADGVPLFDRIGLIRARALGDQLAAKLGKGRAVLMRGHGMTAIGQDIRAATVAAWLLEEAAELQLRILSATARGVLDGSAYTRDELDRVRAEFDQPRVIDRAWEYLIHLLERDTAQG